MLIIKNDNLVIFIQYIIRIFHGYEVRIEKAVR